MLEFGYEIIIVARILIVVLWLELKSNCIEYDLSNVDGLKDLAAEIGNIDILINNAGYIQPKYSVMITIQKRHEIISWMWIYIYSCGTDEYF